MDIFIQEIHKRNHRIISYLNTINQQLNAFATGYIPQSVIPPKQMKVRSLNISRLLPDTMRLPENMEGNL